MAQVWPPQLKFSSVSWQLMSQSRSGGQSMSGAEQVVASGAERWRASMELPVSSSDKIKVFRGFLARLRGRVGQASLPVCDGRGPAGSSGADVLTAHSDGSTFSDGSRYRQGTATAALSVDLALNAGRATFVMPTYTPEVGMYFSLPGDRLHIITDVVSHSGTTWVVDFAPWSRMAYPSGTALEFDKPRALMRLASDDSGAMNLDLLRFSRPQLDWVEVF